MAFDSEMIKKNLINLVPFNLSIPEESKGKLIDSSTTSFSPDAINKLKNIMGRIGVRIRSNSQGTQIFFHKKIKKGKFDSRGEIEIADMLYNPGNSYVTVRSQVHLPEHDPDPSGIYPVLNVRINSKDAIEYEFEKYPHTKEFFEIYAYEITAFLGAITNWLQLKGTGWFGFGKKRRTTKRSKKYSKTRRVKHQ